MIRHFLLAMGPEVKIPSEIKIPLCVLCSKLNDRMLAEKNSFSDWFTVNTIRRNCWVLWRTLHCLVTMIIFFYWIIAICRQDCRSRGCKGGGHCALNRVLRGHFLGIKMLQWNNSLTFMSNFGSFWSPCSTPSERDVWKYLKLPKFDKGYSNLASF